MVSKNLSKKTDSRIFPNIRIMDLCLFIESEKALVFSELHLGYEETLNKQGAFIPRFNFEKIKKRLENVFSQIKVEKIAINGDLKHEFGKISSQEWREVLEMLEFLQKNCKELILIRGNHDTILGPIAKWENLKIFEEGYFFETEKIFITHGNKIPKSKDFGRAKTVIIGHEHPAISLKDNVKAETFKCFLKGKYLEKNLIVLPSISEISYGTNILREKTLSPFLNQDLSNFEVWIVEDKPYYFGKIRALE